jgi:hypothetical protein
MELLFAQTVPTPSFDLMAWLQANWPLVAIGFMIAAQFFPQLKFWERPNDVPPSPPSPPSRPYTPVPVDPPQRIPWSDLINLALKFVPLFVPSINKAEAEKLSRENQQ